MTLLELIVNTILAILFILVVRHRLKRRYTNNVVYIDQWKEHRRVAQSAGQSKEII